MSHLPPLVRALRRAALALALLASAGTARAQFAPAHGFHRAQVSVHTSAAQDRVIGWEFRALSTFQATAVGVFDCELSFAPQGGLATPKAIGLWSLSQSLLASATVPAGQGGALCQDGFRYVSIPPTTLVAGQSYVIGVFWPGDGGPSPFDDYPDLQNSNAPVSFHPALQFVQPRYKLAVNQLAFPSSTLPGLSSFLGALNFRIGAGSPDPNPAPSLATTFASNNGFAGCMFDLVATHPSGLTVQGFQMNLGDIVPQSAPVRVSVHWRLGSYAQATESSAGWFHLGTAAVLSWGTNQPTPVPIGGLYLPPGQTIGVYAFLTDYQQHPPGPGVPLLHYTSVPPAAAQYANANLQIRGGVGKGAPPFSGETFAGRMWNGGVLATVGGSPFTSYCFGDGAGAPCPCANHGASGRGCSNSQGAGALLWAEGSASIAAGGPVLRGAGVPPGRTALFFQADQAVGGGNGASFGDGLRCAGGDVRRIELRQADAAGELSTTVDVAARGGAAAGQSLRYQLWYRDPSIGPCGSGFNLSQGLAIAWLP